MNIITKRLRTNYAKILKTSENLYSFQNLDDDAQEQAVYDYLEDIDENQVKSMLNDVFAIYLKEDYTNAFTINFVVERTDESADIDAVTLEVVKPLTADNIKLFKKALGSGSLKKLKSMFDNGTIKSIEFNNNKAVINSADSNTDIEKIRQELDAWAEEVCVDFVRIAENEIDDIFDYDIAFEKLSEDEEEVYTKDGKYMG